MNSLVVAFLSLNLIASTGAATQRATEGSAATGLDATVEAIRFADYAGDRAGLLRLAGTLQETKDDSLDIYRSYWRGFALWRRALNGFNEQPFPADLRADLDDAVRSFQAALAKRPGWIEATVGLVGCQSNLLFLTGSDTTATNRILEEYVPVFIQMAKAGADHPRALWIVGGAQLGAPPPYGGDVAKAAATMRRGVEAARREARASAGVAAYIPTWGGPENLMNLAYLHTHSQLKDRALALAYAEGALAAVPHWHYVADILLPQIQALDASAASPHGK